MVRPKTKHKERECNICLDLITLSQRNTYLECPYCPEVVHKSCAKDERAIAANGVFYCENHKRHAPTKSARRERNNDHQKVSTEMRATNSLNNDEQTKNVQLNPEKVPFSTSELNILEISQAVLAKILPALIPLSLQHNPHHTQQLVSEKNKYRYSDDRQVRKPNGPDTSYPQMDEKCQGCKQKCILGKYFQCVKCAAYYHDACVNGTDRIREHGGFWSCDQCEKEERNIRFRRSSDEFIKRVENIRLDDSYVPMSTLYNHIQNPISLTSFQNLPPVAKAQSEDQSRDDCHNRAPPEEKNLAEQIKSVVAQALNQDSRRAVNEQAQGTQQQPAIPRAQSTPTAQNQRTEQPPNRVHFSNDGNQQQGQDQIPTSGVNDYIQRMVREAINQHQQPQNPMHELIECNRQLAQVQLLESRKNAARTLPKVKKVGYEWKIFYKTFLNTKSLFSPVENVIRVHEAIESQEILELGGGNIHTPELCDTVLAEINKRIGKPENLLLAEKLKLVETPKLKNNDVTETIRFIENVKKYNSMVENLGSYADKVDSALMARIHQILPERLQNIWLSKRSKIFREEGFVMLADISSWLDEQIDVYESRINLEKMNPYGELKKKEEKMKIKVKKTEMLFHTSEQDEESDGEQNEEMVNFSNESEVKNKPILSCWFHENSQHTSFNCVALLRKTGKEVTNLAKEKNICTICNYRKHNGVCPYKEKYITCIIPGCSMRHCFLFCFKRNSGQKKSQSSSTDSRKTNAAKEVPKEQKSELSNNVNVSRNDEEISLVKTNEVFSSVSQHNPKHYNMLASNTVMRANQNHTLTEIDFKDAKDSENFPFTTQQQQQHSVSSSSFLSVVVFYLITVIQLRVRYCSTRVQH